MIASLEGVKAPGALREAEQDIKEGRLISSEQMSARIHDWIGIAGLKREPAGH